ncbi:hypothetical protein CONLIGDRAFT_649459 [Coniochaeta ligniaria NRRL 30616]|uniref:Uncharacterized protein n=1 Tax=Coniochaeta ligniaria NRRL 30616 TaxID=1408157 RepID=A0A1J7I714_9PEZI|nr:hypothetical protein CONLIGDRAFT_649459 [Coniochaeta ligniaria NRRL 30616]
MTFLAAILECITGSSSSDGAHARLQGRFPFDTKQQLVGEQNDQELAADIIDILRTAEKAGPSLQRRLESTIGTRSWTESIARAVLNGVIDLVQEGRDKIGPAMAEALKRVEDEATNAFEFAKDHPKEVLAGLVIIIAVGILVVMMAPWIVEALGFAELGPVEGSFAAWWESLYAGYIPRGSLFSYLQRLGMTWK